MAIDLHERISNVLNAPAYDKSCDPRCDPSRASHPLAKKLLYVPHYKLADNLNLDQQKIVDEINTIEDITWNGYNNDVKQVRGAGVSHYWSARMLRNFISDSTFGFGETLDYMDILGLSDRVVNGRVPPELLVDTEIVSKVPYIVSIINRFVTWDMCDRIMISKVNSNERINWHSHNYYEQQYTHAYIHIPLITTSDTSMLVYMDGKLHDQHYGFDEAWIINTQHNHAVNNKHGSTRYHILCLASFEDPKLNEILSH